MNHKSKNRQYKRTINYLQNIIQNTKDEAPRTKYQVNTGAPKE